MQFNYSITERHAERSLLPTALERGVAVLINEPFDRGHLFAAVKGKTLPAWAADYNINNWSQFFLKYIISHPSVTCVIPGTSNPANAAANMLAAEGPLPDEAMRKKMASLVQSL